MKNKLLLLFLIPFACAGQNNLMIAEGVGYNFMQGNNNIFIGKNAARNNTTGKYIIVIGDHSKNDTVKYDDYAINIDWNWGFFGTHEGAELKGYIRAWQRSFKFSGGGEGFTIARQEHVDDLREYIISYWLDRIVNYYRIK